MLMQNEDLDPFSICKVLDEIAEGSLTSEKMASRVIGSKKGKEFWLDKKRVALLDLIKLHGKPMGVLHGIPVGLNFGKPINHSGNSTLEEKLLTNGAVPAYYHPTKSHNRSPKSFDTYLSAGISANTSAISKLQLSLSACIGYGYEFTPKASEAGLFSYVPSAGIVSCHGITTEYEDYRIGVFANYLDGLAYLGDAIAQYDSWANFSLPYPPPRLVENCQKQPPIEPTLSTFDLTGIGYRTDYLKDFDDTIAQLGSHLERVQMSDFELVAKEFQEARVAYEGQLPESNIRENVLVEMFRPGEKRPVGERTCSTLEDLYRHWGRFFERFFLDYDCIVLPATLGGEDPTFPPITMIAEYCGLPQISLPILMDEEGNPVGLLIIGKFWEDDRLFRTANWIVNQMKPYNLENEHE